ncbi:ABC transporter permease [Streptococcus sp. DD12]|uniref:ABC transporter permease n=1 Tax=Streptococcus sp. DD12 TaxID=1777880 RepID=UPI00079CB4EB|nr:ABC transporter permease [Streptococcus sp. DD12]KXT76070.1 ABC transporter membrane-spanning permease, Pep export, Vex3 [Streptococcus sp. DD12]
MNFIKRAWLYTWAKKGKSLLLILVTSVILTFVLAGLTINKAAKSAVETAKQETGATVTLQVSRDYMMQQMEASKSSSDSSSNEPPTMTMTPIPLETAQKIAEKSGVKSYLFTTTTTATAGSGISAISSSSTTSSSSTNQQNGPSAMQSGDFTITGVNTTDNVSDFSNGTNTLKSGVGITASTADNEAVISSDLAKANNLSVGDSFTVTTTVNNTSTSYTLKVVGIYTSTATVTASQLQNKASNPQNNIYTNLTTANTMKGSSDTVDSAVYTLSNPSKKDSFVSNAKKDIDTEKYELTGNDQVYQQMLQPLNSIASIAKNIVWLVSIAGAIILTLIVILSIRERRYEIGVLMSLGEGRLKIISQFFVELFVVMLVSIGLATAAGNVVGNVLGQQLISQQTSTTQTSTGAGQGGGPGENTSASSSSTTTSSSQTSNNQPPQGGNGAPNMTTSSSQLNSLNIKQTPASIAKLGGIALLISLASTVLASIGIIRMKPKDILSSN